MENSTISTTQTRRALNFHATVSHVSPIFGDLGGYRTSVKQRRQIMTIKNNRVYIAVGMFCGTDDSDLLVPEVYESREDARKAIIK